MGNVRSVFLCRDADIDWNAYIAEPWRSDRMRELDQLGGLDRPAIRRGNSMTAKLEYLQAAVHKQGDSMQDALAAGPSNKQKANQKRNTYSGKFALNTELRAREREEFDDLSHIQPASQPVQWGGPTPEQSEKDRQAKIAARNRMFEYARNAQASGRLNGGSNQSGAPDQASMSTSMRRSTTGDASDVRVEATEYSMAGSSDRGSETTRRLAARASMASDRASDASCTKALLRKGSKDQVAAWRLRIHRARRRAIMVVLTVVRLRRGFNHPRRMQRVDSFSYCIPLVLNDEYMRFIEEAGRYNAIVEEIQDCKDSMDALLAALLQQGIQTASGLPLATGTGLSASRLTKPSSRRTHSAAPANGAPSERNSTSPVGGGVITGAGSRMRSLSASASAAAMSTAADAAAADSEDAGSGPLPSGPSITSPMGSGPSLTTLVEEPPSEDRWAPAGVGTSGQSILGGPVTGASGFKAGGIPLRPALAGRRAPRNSDASSSGAGPSGDAGAASNLSSPGSGSVGPRRAVRISENGETFGSGPGYGPGQGGAGNGEPSPSSSRRVRVSEGGFGGGGAGGGILGAVATQLAQQGRRRASLVGGTDGEGDDSLDASPVGRASSRPTTASSRPGTATASDAGGAGGGAYGAGGAGVSMTVSDSAASFTFRLSAGSSASGAEPDRPRNPLFSRRDGQLPSASSGGTSAGDPRHSQSFSHSISDTYLGSGGADGPSSSSSVSTNTGRNLSHGGGGDSRPGSTSFGANHNRTSTSMVARIPRASDPSSLSSPTSPGRGNHALHASTSMRGVSAGGTGLSPLMEGGADGAKQLRKSTENARMAMLTRRLEQQSESLTKCELMLGMFVNRANAAWAEQQRGWRSAHSALALPGDMTAAEGTEEYKVYKADLIRKLRAGQVVFQIFAAEDVIQPSGGGSGPASAGSASSGGRDQGNPAGSTQGPPQPQPAVDLWTADPWNIIASMRPGSVPLSGERLDGLSMGGRVLTQLRAAVEAAAGPEAAAGLTVVLHIHDGQRDAVIRELSTRRLYGIRRENLYLTVQQRRSGYRYDPEYGEFIPIESTTEQRSLGPGHAMMQLCWVSDAYTLSEPPECALLPLPLSLIETLQKRGVEWLVSRRSSDLSLYCAGSALNIPHMVQALHMRDKARATMVTEVTHTSNMTVMRQLDSIVLNMMPSSTGSTNYGPIKAKSSPQGVVELRSCELASTAMADVVTHVRAESPTGEVLVGLHRYAFHLPSLAVVLSDVNVFRPKLSLCGGSVYIGIELSDLTTAPRSRCLAIPAAPLIGPSGAPLVFSMVSAGSAAGSGGGMGGGSGAGAGIGPLPLLSTPAEVEELVPLIQVQDNDLDFRKAVSGCRAASIRYHDGSSPPVSRGHMGTMLKPTTPSASSDTLTGRLSGSAPGSGAQRIVVFVADNEVTHTAVEFVAMFGRPGKDEVFLMTVVPSDMHQEAGQQLLTRHFRTLSRCMMQPRVDVMSKGYSGLLDCLERYATSVDATLVVMGSQAMTSSAVAGGSSSSIGGAANSVTLSCVKRLQLPIVVVTANTRLTQGDMTLSRGSIGLSNPTTRISKARVMAVAEAHAKSMVHFLSCSGMLDPLRGDKLILGQVFPSGRGGLNTQQLQAAKRVLDTFSDVSAGHHMQAQRLLLDGAFDKVLHATADSELLHLLALMPKPSDKVFPAELLSLIRSCRAAILLYRDRPGTSYG